MLIDISGSLMLLTIEVEQGITFEIVVSIRLLIFLKILLKNTNKS